MALSAKASGVSCKLKSYRFHDSLFVLLFTAVDPVRLGDAAAARKLGALRPYVMAQELRGLAQEMQATDRKFAHFCRAGVNKVAECA